MVEYFHGKSNAGELKAVLISLVVVAVLLVIWRITFRYWKRVLNLSDYFLVPGLILALCQAGFYLAAYTRWGYGWHRGDLPPHVAKSLRPKFLLWLNQVIFKLGSGFIKLSICALYREIFRNDISRTVRVSRALNYLLAAFITIYYSAASLVSLLQCIPMHKAWHPSVRGHCIHNNTFRVANGLFNIITSAWLILLPWPTLLQVKHPSKELWQLMGLVSLGVIHTGCAIYRVALMFREDPDNIGRADVQWTSTRTNIVAMVEEYVGIIAATIIVMRPCFHVFWNTLTGGDTTVIASPYDHYDHTVARTRITKPVRRDAVSFYEDGVSGGLVQIHKTTEIEMEFHGLEIPAQVYDNRDHKWSSGHSVTRDP